MIVSVCMRLCTCFCGYLRVRICVSVCVCLFVIACVSV